MRCVSDLDEHQETIIPRNQNTFAKLQREREKRRKAEEKRKRRLERKTEIRKAQSGPAPQAEVVQDSETVDHEKSSDGDEIVVQAPDADDH